MTAYHTETEQPVIGFDMGGKYIIHNSDIAKHSVRAKHYQVR